MKKSVSRWLGLLLVSSVLTWTALAAPAIVIKLDDLTPDQNSITHFGNVFALLRKHGVKGSFGVIGQRYLDEPGKDKRAAYAMIAGWSKSGVVEIWHHGWVHSPTEFKTASLDEQLQAFRRTIEVMREKCGIELVSFGAPHNATDATTLEALDQIGSIKYFMFPGVRTGAKVGLLTRRLNMEVTTGDVRFAELKKNFEANSDWPYMVLQGHPNRWEEAQLREFEAIIEFLRAKGCEFLTPREAGERLAREMPENQSVISTFTGRQAVLTRSYTLQEVQAGYVSPRLPKDPFNIDHPVYPSKEQIDELRHRLTPDADIWYFRGHDSGWAIVKDHEVLWRVFTDHEY